MEVHQRRSERPTRAHRRPRRRRPHARRITAPTNTSPKFRARPLSGNPIRGTAEVRAAAERIAQQYSRFDARTLAVRGERLHLAWGLWSNDAGYETTHLYVQEIGDDGRIVYEGRFDSDDFEAAYR